MPAAMGASTRRWLTLSVLLRAIERGVEASARLDAYPEWPGTRARPSRMVATPARAIAFDDRLRVLEARIDRELDRLTAERLRVDLAQKQGSRA